MSTITTVQISEGIELKIYPSGVQEWYKDGKLHRDNDQPAIIYSTGMKIRVRMASVIVIMIIPQASVRMERNLGSRKESVIVIMINLRSSGQMERNLSF